MKKGYAEEWFIGKGMEMVKVIRKDDIRFMCRLFRVSFWEMYCAIHQDYVIKFS